MSIFYHLSIYLNKDENSDKLFSKELKQKDVATVYKDIYCIIASKFPAIEISDIDVEGVAEGLEDEFKEISDDLIDYIIEDMIYLISENYTLSLAELNNVSSFLKKALAHRNFQIPKKIRSNYTTLNKFCKKNCLSLPKLKEILKSKKYYNEKFNFIPSSIAIKTNKTYISTYGLLERFKHYEDRYQYDFYVTWNIKFLKTIVKKYYKYDKRDSIEEKLKYRTPRNNYELLRRIESVVMKIYYMYDYYKENDIEEYFEDEYDIDNIYDELRCAYRFTDIDYLMFVSGVPAGGYRPYNEFKDDLEFEIMEGLELTRSLIKKEDSIQKFKILEKILLKYIKHYKKILIKYCKISFFIKILN